jgi:hypothetical protein
MNTWNGIMKVLEIEHISRNGSILHRETEIKNIIHSSGEDLILKILFAGHTIPTNYYVGLDARSSLDKLHTIGDIFGREPTSNSYSRQTVASNNFSVVSVSAGYRQANSPTLLFRAAGGSWGPVKNIFLTTALGYGADSLLISSVPLSAPITVSDGEIVTMRMAMALSSC